MERTADAHLELGRLSEEIWGKQLLTRTDLKPVR